MKRELIITIIIVIVIIIAGIVTQNNTKKIIGQITDMLESIKQDILIDSKEQSEYDENIDNIYEQWLENDQGLSIYLEHNELEKVTTEIREIKGNIEAGEIKESVPHIETCMATLEHIEEKQAFNLQNIF